MRLHDQTQVYYVKDKVKHPVTSADAFEAHGWDFGNIKVVADVLEFENIPNGHPIS